MKRGYKKNKKGIEGHLQDGKNFEGTPFSVWRPDMKGGVAQGLEVSGLEPSV